MKIGLIVIGILFMIGIAYGVEESSVTIHYDYNNGKCDIQTPGGFIEDYSFPMVMDFNGGNRVDIYNREIKECSRGVSLEFRKKDGNRYSLSLKAKDGVDQISKSLDTMHSDDDDDHFFIVTRKSSGEIVVTNGLGRFLGNWTSSGA